MLIDHPSAIKENHKHLFACWLSAIFWNEITTILTPSTSEGGEWSRWGGHIFRCEDPWLRICNVNMLMCKCIYIYTFIYINGVGFSVIRSWEIDKRTRGLFCTKFNSEQHLFETFFWCDAYFWQQCFLCYVHFGIYITHTMLTAMTSLYIAPYKSSSPVLSIHLGSI